MAPMAVKTLTCWLERWREALQGARSAWSECEFVWEWPQCPWPWDAIAFTNTVLLTSISVSTFTFLHCRAKQAKLKRAREDQRQLVYERLLRLVVEKLLQRHMTPAARPVNEEIDFLANKARYLRMLHTALNEVSEKTLLGNQDHSEDKYFKELNLKIDKVKEEICVLLKRMRQLKVDEIFSPELKPIISELELDC